MDLASERASKLFFIVKVIVVVMGKYRSIDYEKRNDNFPIGQVLPVVLPGSCLIQQDRTKTNPELLFMRKGVEQSRAKVKVNRQDSGIRRKGKRKTQRKTIA
jgi:hypothetical protein